MTLPLEFGPLEFGLDTFGDVTRGADGALLSHAQVIRDVIAEGVLADRLGVDVFGIGEHHREDFAVSSPEMVLAAIAGQTTRIRLGSAVTVLSSDDPVRVYQRFATLDAASGGRAEVILGRGSFTESFPLFGFDLEQYELLFREKLDLFVKLLPQEPISWNGMTRPALRDQRIYPPVEHAPLKSWVGVGGSPESVVRAARHGLPLMLAIIGGEPGRFAPYAALYREALGKLGQPPLPVGIHSPGHVAETDAQAREELWPCYKAMRDRIGAERGWSPVTPDDFAWEIEHGSLFAGSPETVAQKIAAAVRALGAQRFQMKYSSGALAHDKLMRSIELFATRVIPRVRELLG